MSLSFGTDGIRGVANLELTPELALGVGRAAARVLEARAFVLGQDSRRSGTLLTSALTAGILAEGVDVIDLGVVPTPAVAAEAAERGLAGAMVSASHNPAPDNGIKLFAPGGRKLTDELEAEIEAVLADPPARSVPVGAEVGIADRGRPDAWLRLVPTALEGRRLDGLHLVVDAANGAASHWAADLLAELGATVTPVADSPDGLNINADCGSTSLGLLQATVVAADADLGLALDGDADRVVAVDHRGRPVDGDRILALLALDRRTRGRLAHDTVVVTVMTNLGFHRAMAEAGIRVVSTGVGDRYVLEAMEAGGFTLGGEQSGHVISADLARTGDGVLTGVQLCDLLVRSGARLADLAGEVMTQVPQLLRNVRLERRDPGLLDAMRPRLDEVEAEMGDDGRVLVRLSGTEPLLRVMVEHVDADHAEKICAQLVADAERLTAS